MAISDVVVDSAFTPTLTTSAVVPVLNGATTGTGNATAGMTTLSDLATFFGANIGPITTTSAITFSGSSASPAGTVRYVGGSGASDLGINVASGGNIAVRVAGSTQVSVGSGAMTVGVAGAAFVVQGRAASGTDTASGAISLKANQGTGTGAVGGFIIQVPVTTVSGTGAQTLTTAITVGATTYPTITMGGKLQGAVSTTARAGFNLGNAGTAPTSPVDGDMWIESNTVKVRLNGATVTVTTS